MLQCVTLRSQLNSQLKDAIYELYFAKAFLGDAVKSTAYASRRDISLDIKVKNVWGVNVPEVEQKAFVRDMDARDISPIGEGSLIIETAQSFEKWLMLLLPLPRVR